MAEECVTSKMNLSKSKCRTLPNVFAGMLEVPVDFEITAAKIAEGADAVQEFIQDAIKNGLAARAYKWPDFSSFEDLSEETKYQETVLADLKLHPGKYRWRIGISHSLCLHKAMFTHSGGNTRVIFYDIEGNFFGTEKSNDSMTGFYVSLINVEKLKIGDGTSVATQTPVYIVLKDSNEIDQAGIQLDAPFFNDLEPLTDVELALVVTAPGAAVTTDDFYISVVQECDGTPVSGLVIGDFDMGTLGAPDTVVETSSGSGIYRFTRAANFADGDVNLKAAADLSVDAYESLGAVTVNIP